MVDMYQSPDEKFQKLKPLLVLTFIIGVAGIIISLPIHLMSELLRSNEVLFANIQTVGAFFAYGGLLVAIVTGIVYGLLWYVVEG